MFSRRNFIKTSSVLTTGLMLQSNNNFFIQNNVPVFAHLWVYASKYPPDWDCTPILDTVFSNLKYAGLAGVEVMEILLRHDDAVTRFNDLINKYNLPVVGTSYYGDMWDKNQQQKILDDIELVTERLHNVGGTMIGLTVGDAHHIKTEDELDAQAELLKKILIVSSINIIYLLLVLHITVICGIKISSKKF